MRKFVRAVLATLVVAVSCMAWSFGPGAAVASAGVTDDPDHWAYDAADWIQNECHDVPQSLMGAASGTVVTKGLTPAGSGLGSTPPTTIPTPSASTTYETRNMSGSQLWSWLNAPPSNVPVPASPPATGTVNAVIGSDEYMSALLGADFWEGFVSRNSVNVDFRIPPQQMNAAFIEAGSPFRYPTLPQSTVGGSAAHVIDTTGTVKGATDSSKSVVTPARMAGTGISALSGSTVALSALVFGGSLCGTINGLGAVFGDPWATYEGPFLQLASSPMAPCSATSGAPSYATYGDYCVPVTIPASVNRMTMGYFQHVANPTPVPATNPTFGNIGDAPLRRTSGALMTGAPWSSTAYNSVTPSSTAYAVFPCATPANLCGLLPIGYGTSIQNTPTLNGDGDITRYGTALWFAVNTSAVGVAYPNEDDQSRGRRRRLSATVTCQRPEDTDILTEQKYSAAFWDDQPTPDWPAAPCDNGYAPTAVQLRRQVSVGGGATAATWTTTDMVLDWALPTIVKNNPTTLKCFTVGVLACEKFDLDPGDDMGDWAWGGPDGVPTPKDEPESDDVIDEVIDSTDLDEEPIPESPDDDEDDDDDEDPDDDDDPEDDEDGPTSDPCSGGVPTGTADCGEPPTEGPPGDSPLDPETGECFPSGWGWLNPVEWVLKPVKCALIWAFWDQESADEMGDLWTDTAGPWADTATDTVGDVEFSAAAGPCIEMDVHEICTSVVLEAEMPSAATVFFTAVLAFVTVFEVIGLFARITGG